MNMYTDPVIGIPMIIITIVAVIAGVIFAIKEHKEQTPKVHKNTARYENYIIVDGEIIYPKAVVKHVDIKA